MNRGNVLKCWRLRGIFAVLFSLNWCRWDFGVRKFGVQWFRSGGEIHKTSSHASNSHICTLSQCNAFDPGYPVCTCSTPLSFLIRSYGRNFKVSLDKHPPSEGKHSEKTPHENNRNVCPTQSLILHRERRSGSYCHHKCKGDITYKSAFLMRNETPI